MGVEIASVPVTVLSAVAVLLGGVPICATVSTVVSAELTAGESDLLLSHTFHHLLIRLFVRHPGG